MDEDKQLHNSDQISGIKRILGLLQFMTDFKQTYVLAVLALGIASILQTGTYYLIRFFVDKILIDQTQKELIPWIAAAFMGLALFQGLFTYFSGRLAARTAEGVVLRVRKSLFDHIQRLTFSYHDVTPTGDLIQRTTSDVDAVRRFFSDQAIGFGRIALLFIVNLIALLLLNWQLALLSIVVVPIIIVLSYAFFKRISVAYEKYQEQDAVLSTTLQENLTGVRVVRAFARQDYERDKFDRENWEKFLKGKHLFFIHSLFWPISDVLVSLQMIAGYTIGAIMAIDGTISVGTYVAYAGLVIWIIWPMRGLGRLIVQMSSGLVSFGRIIRILKVEQEPLEEGLGAPGERLRGDFVFENVGFHYDDAAKVLHEISFRCPPGRSVALLGSTGSGKSTLVNLLPRFYEYTSGSLRLDGVELKEYSRKFLRDQIGIVEQEPFLFSRTIRENIVYGVGRDVADEEVYQAAEAAAIHDVILGFPDGYNTLVGEKGVTLSGGQKQRVAIARALLKNPSILIFDDSTSSVDAETEAMIHSALERLMRNRTTFIIAHRIQSVQSADLILVLDHGRIIQMGTHAELIQQDNVYSRVYELQTRIDTELEKELSGV